MAKIYLNKTEIGQCSDLDYNYNQIVQQVSDKLSLVSNEFYLEQNGRRITATTAAAAVDPHSSLHCRLRINGGKGGFGSMLRAIGAQIEKTTNREACRDLSGRRLRDINEEKRLKAWLEKQGEREREAEERKRRKIEKLLAVPKHEFKDEKYEEARSKLTEKVSDAVEEGMKKAQKSSIAEKECLGKEAEKRKNPSGAAKINAKKPRTALWIGDDISETDDSDEDSSASEDEKTNALKKTGSPKESASGSSVAEENSTDSKRNSVGENSNDAPADNSDKASTAEKEKSASVLN